MSEFISKQNLLTWLGQLMGERNVVAPMRIDDLLLFGKVDRVEDIPALLIEITQPGDIVMTLGAGNIWMAAEKFL